MKEIVYVDFLNIASFFKLVKNERGSNVTYLFRSKSRVLENVLIKILTIFGVRCKFDKMDFNKVKFNPTTKIIDNINSISSSIVDVYGCNISSKVGMFFDYSLGVSVSESLWRQCSITEYLKQLEYPEFDRGELDVEETEDDEEFEDIEIEDVEEEETLDDED